MALFSRGSGAVGFNAVNFIGNYYSGLPSGVVWTKMTGGSTFLKEQDEVFWLLVFDEAMLCSGPMCAKWMPRSRMKKLKSY